MKKKIISVLLAIVMLTGIIPLGTISAFAEEKTDNQYVVRSWDGTKVTEQFVDIPAATTVTSTATVWENGWYVADGTVDISSVRVGGNVNLILKGGCKLTVGGITVTGSDSLTIYAQKGGTGELISKASANNYAGIGGGSKDDGGIITIHGGKITATGGNMAAGIGGGFQGACGTVTIYGGEVTATGGFNGAGIGTGSAPRNNGGSIAIYGGKVTVSTSDNSAMGEQRPRAIGGGFNGSVDTITIGSIMEVSDGSGNIVTAPFGEQTWADVLTGICYTFCLPVVEYLVADGKPAKCDTYTPVTKDTKTWTSGYYVVNEDVEISGDIKISGVVNLILTDGKTLNVDGSMLSDSDLSIYAQSNGEKMGKLNSNGVIQSSGKGSIYIYGGSVTTTNYILGNGGVSIIGGVVTANGHAYGIASNGDIIIKSKVTATGDDSAIWSTGNITLYGEVSATGGKYGICSKGTTTIYGKVSATGENAGIFAERECWIVYGSVTAVGGEFGVECVTKGIRIYESGNTTISGNVRAIKGNGHEIETVEVYNRANERVFNPNETLWDKVLTDTYYRFVTEGSVVPYRYYDIESGEFKDDVYFGCEVIDEYTTEWEIPENNDEKWYAVKGEPVINGNVMVSGEVHLILTDESTLTVNGSITGENAQLYLYAQSTGSMGTLICKGSNGIDGSNSDGGTGNSGISVTALTVNGGTVSATGGTGGTGGTSGTSEETGSAGGDGGKGISVTALTVNGGTVLATGGNGGNGGGENRPGQKGEDGISVEIVNDGTINGTVAVKANEADSFIPLPSGESISDYRFAKITNTLHTHDFKGDYVDNGDGTHSRKCTGCEKLDTPEEHTFENYTCVCGAHNWGKYIDRKWDEETEKVISEEKNIPTDAKEITADTTELEGGWYVVSGTVTVEDRIRVTGGENKPTNIVLLDGAVLNATAGIEVKVLRWLNIYGQKNDTGKIVANGGTSSAGIGGSSYDVGGTVTINGGIITASSEYGAGIGGGGDINIRGCKVEKVTINGGTVMASSTYGAGIGGGIDADGGTVIVNGGTVTASSEVGAGIGGGYKCERHDTLTIADGLTVKAGYNADTAVAVTAEEYIINRNPYVTITPAHTHDFKGDYVDNGDGTHSRKCTGCDALGEPENHTYKDGVCDKCGAGIITLKNGAVSENGFIFGLAPKLTSLTDYIDVAEGYELEYSTDKIVTGTEINAAKDNISYASLTVVIFGDVNNDGVYDGMDAVIVNCLANGMLTREQVGEAVYMAADCNHDRTIDSNDVDILQQAGVLLASVDQSKSEEELFGTNSAYVEYFNLIQQSPETESTAENAMEDTPAADKEPAQINWFQIFVPFIKMLLKLLNVVFKF